MFSTLNLPYPYPVCYVSGRSSHTIIVVRLRLGLSVGQVSPVPSSACPDSSGRNHPAKTEPSRSLRPVRVGVTVRVRIRHRDRDRVMVGLPARLISQSTAQGCAGGVQPRGQRCSGRGPCLSPWLGAASGFGLPNPNRNLSLDPSTKHNPGW